MVKSLNQIIQVDYYIPGCPPLPDTVYRAINFALGKGSPPCGPVFAETKALCDSCPRKATKADRINLKAFKRIHKVELEPDTCFLDQGIICLGPVTRGGCGSRCIMGNMPCRGCFGPLDTVEDQGAKALSFIASLVELPDPYDVERITASVSDLGGLIYRYSLPTSILKGRLRG